MFPPKIAPPPELDVQLFFGISRDLIQQLGEGIQLPLCSSTYFPKCLPLLRFGISRDLIQQLGEVIQLPLCSYSYFPKGLALL